MPVTGLAQNLDTELDRWMSDIDDSSSLADWTIPGTHNAGARFEPVAGTAACQDLTIGAQLDIGIRFLDVQLHHFQTAFLFTLVWCSEICRSIRCSTR